MSSTADRRSAAGAQMQQRVGSSLPMRRVEQVGEVAATAVWLCSDEAAFITGATLPVDDCRLAAMVPFAAGA